MFALNNCEFVENPVLDSEVFVTGKCIVTGDKYTVRCKKNSFIKYLEGEKIQNAFNYLSCDDREFLQSGYSPTGWNQVFGEEE